MKFALFALGSLNIAFLLIGVPFGARNDAFCPVLSYIDGRLSIAKVVFCTKNSYFDLLALNCFDETRSLKVAFKWFVRCPSSVSRGSEGVDPY
jgi:hypothetical protein